MTYSLNIPAIRNSKPRHFHVVDRSRNLKIAGSTNLSEALQLRDQLWLEGIDTYVDGYPYMSAEMGWQHVGTYYEREHIYYR